MRESSAAAHKATIAGIFPFIETMSPPSSYYWQRLSSRLHRARIALHTRGWHGLIQRIRGIGSDPGESRYNPQTGAATTGETAAPAPGGRRLLMIDVAVPRPDHDSGSLRAWNLMHTLRDQGHAVDFLPDNGHDDGHYGNALRALGIGVHAGPRPGGYPHWLGARLLHYDTIIVCRYHLGEFLIPLIRSLMPNARIVLDTVDLHHLREAREATLRGDRHLARLSRSTRRRELSAIAAADITWVVSPDEARLLQSEAPGARIIVLPNIHDIAHAPNGYTQRKDLLFLGGARHPPNADAIRWLAEDIYPRIRANLPDCALHVVGPGVEHALDHQPLPQGVHLHGFVADITPLLQGCRVGLAPLRFGAGVKGKINACMAAGMPVVATSCAAEGMHLTDGMDMLVGDDAETFATAVERLYLSPSLWQTLSKAGIENVSRHFSFDTARAALNDTFTSA